MQKLVVVAKTKKHLLELIEKDIDAVLIYIDKLSVNNSFSMSINEVNEIDFKGKEVFLCINKIMHSSSLPLVREFLEQVKDKNYKILFYDMGVYNIAKDIHIEDKLVIYQDHLNANTYSNNFYYDLGIKGSYINIINCDIPNGWSSWSRFKKSFNKFSSWVNFFAFFIYFFRK